MSFVNIVTKTLHADKCKIDKALFVDLGGGT